MRRNQKNVTEDDFIMIPTVDFYFKELMKNENIRKGIVAALLKLHPEDVEKTDLMPTILQKQYEDDKYGILDVRVKLKNGVQIDFEMQVVYYDYWANRSAYYLGKMYVDQIREGDSYDRLQKCIQVSILDHTYFQDDEKCYRRIALCDTETGKEYTDLLEMHILELSKLPPEQKNETDLLQWMRFLGGKCREDFKKMAENNSTFEEAYDVLDRLSADEKKRLEYEARQKAIRDHDIMMKTAKRLGLEAGIAEGREKGIAEGREQEKRNIIREMLQDHIPDYKIKQYTGATDKEISEEKSRLF